jgi:hypothetical protein
MKLLKFSVSLLVLLASGCGSGSNNGDDDSNGQPSAPMNPEAQLGKV